MQTKLVEISKLNLDPVNARKHNPKNLDVIKSSLAKFGQQKPIVIDKNNVVVAGNGTLEAAKSLGWEKISAVVTKLTGADLTAYGIADNRSAELAEWDDEVLSGLIKSLHAEDFDLDTIGFDIEDFTMAELDYGVVGDEDMEGMAEGVKKAIQIEFEQDDYEEAKELVKYWREREAYVGGLIIGFLKKEKEKLKK